MRIIKFEGWDTKSKKMWSPEEMGEDELTINPDGRGFVNVNGSSTKLSHYLSHIIPLQFTGLRDKKGEEIYEGDIIKSGLGEIFWSENHASFMVRWHNKQWQNIRGMEEPLFQNSEIAWEIIGNIYENPELFEAKI